MSWGGEKFPFLPPPPDRLWPHSKTNPRDYAECYVWELKRSRSEADSSPPFSVGVTNTWPGFCLLSINVILPLPSISKEFVAVTAKRML
jgi:hypothetical protein